MAKDTNISARTTARYLSELCQVGLIEKQRRLLGTKIHLMARATDEGLEGREFLVDEVGKLSHDEAEAFLSELVPLHAILRDVRDCFVN